MPSWRHALCTLAVLAAVLFALPGVAFAQSAGNQQYIDPLAGNTTPSSTTTGSSHGTPSQTPSPSSAPSSSAPASTGPAPSSSSQGTTTTTTPSSTTSASGTSQPSGTSGTSAATSSGTLPFTGFDLAPSVAVACGLLLAGIALRRATRPGE